MLLGKQPPGHILELMYTTDGLSNARVGVCSSDTVCLSQTHLTGLHNSKLQTRQRET